MFQALLNKEKTIAVIGLGYVGLPIALGFAEKFKVIGFDINQRRIDSLTQGIDPNGESEPEEFTNKDVVFTSNPEDLKAANFYIVTVPTPIDKHKKPDLTPLVKASQTLGKVLKKGDYVVYESTVYPGCTEEDCVPILEEISGLKFNQDFKVGYSPERINPGDKVHTLTKITKVVSGSDAEALEIVAAVYGAIIEAGIHKASSIKVAEAAKIIENTQRDINIALMNELSLIFDKLGINTFEVLEAAGTKWNFLKFTPGLVGGHCIGVDPYYLTHKSIEVGHDPRVILAGRELNDSIGQNIAKVCLQKLIKLGKDLLKSRVLVLGATFKENVSDIRNSKVIDIVNELKFFNMNVEIWDPLASSEEMTHEYGTPLTAPSGTYDAVIVAVSHEEFLTKPDSYFTDLMNTPALFMDVKGVFRNRRMGSEYWSL